MLTAGMTAFYMFRLLFVTFHGECRASEEVKHHIHESPKIMTVPLMILAVLSIVGGYVGVPHILGGGNHFEKWLEPVVGGGGEKAHASSFDLVTQAFASGGAEGEGSLEMTLMIVAVLVAAFGIFLAYLMFLKKPELSERFVERFKGFYTTVNHKYYVDEIYNALFVQRLLGLGRFLKNIVDEILIDGTINGLAWLVRGIGSVVRLVQTGYVQGYAVAIMAGAIIVLGYLVLRMIL
jgi:NADH-quinone oxidoreductase subunit L